MSNTAELSPQERRRLLESLLRKKAAKPRRRPLSFSQQRLWILDQLDPANPAYNIPLAIRLRGTLDIDAFNRALSELVARHEALRTRVALIDDRAVQVVEPPTREELTVVDLGGVAFDRRDQEALARAQAEARRPFQLDENRLFRALLLRLGPIDHVLVVVVHHIIADDWSMAILFREVAALYQAFMAGQPSPLERPSLQYSDYAFWQRDRLQGEVFDRLLDHWRDQLHGVPALELPTDRPRPPRVGHAGGTERAMLPADLARQLREIGRREGATLFMTLLAGFQTLLYRYSGQEDFAVGSPIAGRLSRETEGCVGFFANTLVLRANLADNPTFRELLRRTRKTALEAYEHQEMPFERLVEALNPTRDTSRNPLFQVAFALQNAPWPEVTLGGITFSVLPLEAPAAKFDLWLSMRETAAGLQAELEYNADLFDAFTIRQMLGHLETLLNGIAEDPDRRISDLPLLAPSERQQLLGYGNRVHERAPVDKCIHQLVEDWARRTPEAVAVRLEDQQLCYGDLNRRANQLAHYLRARGVGPESLVALYLDRSLEMVVALLGILKAGGAYLPIELAYPADRVAFMLDESGAEVLLTQERLQDRLPSHSAQVICIDRDWDLIASESEANPGCQVATENLAYVIYTSGSTGKPKGALITHANVVRLFTETEPWFHFGPGDVWTMFHSYAFDFSVWEIWGALVYGGCVVVVPYWVSRSPQAFYDLLHREQVTVLNQTPSAFTQLIAAEEQAEDPSRQLALRLVIFGGEALNLQTLKPWFERHGDRRPQLVNMYGITETTVHVTYHPLSRADLDRPHRSPIGRPIPDLAAYVLDAHGNLVPVGMPGELHVGGRGVARGYLNRPELTRERFVPNPYALAPEDRLYRSGDVVRWLPDGNLEYLGRCDHQVKIRGFRVELGEIESLLTAHPTLRQAFVMLREDRASDQRIVAYVVPHESQRVTSGELRAFLQAKLPEYMVPSAFVSLPAMPLTSNGKVDRRALPAVEEKRGELSVAYAPPRNPIEQQLAKIWQEVLRIDRVGIHDNFFELGGHSLLAARVMSQAQRVLQVRLPLRDVFERPTIAGLAEAVLARQGNSDHGDRPPLTPVPRDAELPLSFTQEALWFLDQLERDHPTYTVYPVLRLRGTLNVPVLERAMGDIARRHEALRTRFPEVKGRPVQIIEPWTPRRLPVIDLSGQSDAERHSSLERCIAEETCRPIDLQQGPLVRVTLLKLSEDEHALVAAAHHIIFDGWSLAIMARELSVLYQAFREGRPSPMPELPIQYADFALWQRRWLQGETLERLRTWWTKQLSGVSPLDLPTDYPRPAVRTTRGATIPCDLSPELSDAVRDFCRREGATPFMTLLAAFQALLARYSGQEDFAVGSPVANRAAPETEPLIGYFINMVVLRSDLSGEPSFRDLVRRVHRTALDAFEHQELPLDLVVDAVKPPRDASRHPLFQVMFVLQNNEAPSLDGMGLDIAPLDGLSTSRSAYFELTLALEETDQGFRGSLNFNTDLFAEETIRRMARHFQSLLAAALAGPERPLSELPLTTKEELRTLVVDWNNTVAEYPREKCIHELFEAQAQKTPDAVAVVDGARTWTYRKLDQRANQLAHALRALGVAPDQLVAVRLPRSAEWVMALLGILKAGAAYLPLDPQLPAERLRFMLEDARVKIAVTKRDWQNDLPEGLEHVVCVDAEEAFQGHSIKPLPRHSTSDHLAYVIYTSGSTGRPKGVMIEHRALVNYAIAVSEEYAITPGDRVLQFTSASYDGHVEEVFPCLTRGATLVLRSDEMLDCKRFLDLCGAWKVTFVTVPTGFWHELAAAIERENLAVPASLRLIVIGGEQAMPQRVATWFKCAGGRVRLFNTYGPTETTVVATATELCELDGREERVPIGRPLRNYRAYVLDRHLRPLPVGVPGELCLGGDGLARGYLNCPDMTAQRFVPDPFSEKPRARLYRTGDIVRWRSDGRLEFIGRVDHQVKIRGFRIEPGEVERAILEHPSIADAAVVPRERSPGNLQLVAYVVGRDGDLPTASRMRRFLAERVPEFMAPAAFVLLPELPKTNSGKIDRTALPSPDWGSAARTHAKVPPRTDTERRLASIWAELLNLESVGGDDDFFDLGGHSLLALRLMSRIRETFSAELPLVQVFTTPTLAGLAEAIDDKTSRAARSLVLLRPGGADSPLFCIHGLGGHVGIFLPLARGLESDRAVYALQAQGLDAGQTPHDRMETMAASYLDEIREVQPHGPYRLAGWSLGGMIALEAATQLRASGEEVALVALLDTYLSVTDYQELDLDDQSTLRWIAPHLGLSVSDLKRLPLDRQWDEIAEKASAAHGIGVAEIGRLAATCQAHLKAAASCTPKPYDGLAVLFQATSSRAGMDRRWQDLCPCLRVESVPGDHYSMLRNPNADVLADRLVRYLKECSKEGRPGGETVDE